MAAGDTSLPHRASVISSHAAYRDALETGHMECDIAGSGIKVSVVVPAAVALADLVSLVSGSL